MPKKTLLLWLTALYLHFVVRQNHSVNLHALDVVAVVANYPGQLHFSDLVKLFCAEQKEQDGGGVSTRVKRDEDEGM